MFTMLLLAGAVAIAVVLKYIYKPAERCPECGAVRDPDDPICRCGYVFEFPEDDEPFEYGDPEETP